MVLGIVFSMVRALVEGDEEEEGFVEGDLSKGAPLPFFSGGFSYVHVCVVNPTVSVDIILISSMEEEVPCKDMWSINYCCDGKWSISTIRAGLFFKNILTSSFLRHSLVKWSSPHKRQGYLPFLFGFDSFSGVVVFGFSF